MWPCTTLTKPLPLSPLPPFELPIDAHPPDEDPLARLEEPDPIGDPPCECNGLNTPFGPIDPIRFGEPSAE
jgi:hypothetical protein